MAFAIDGSPHIQRSEWQLDQRIGDLAAVAIQGAVAQVVVLPERLDDADAGTLAAFESETQAFRVDLEAKGATVGLVLPPDTAPAGSAKYAADWIMPVILLAGQVPVNVTSTLIADWIRNRYGELGRKPKTLRYREAEMLADGTVRVVEIEGPPEEVATIVERRTAGLPGGSDTTSP